MAPRDHRKKASEIHRDTTYAFSQKVSFAEAFPSIAHVRVEVTERGDGVHAEYQPSVYTEQRLGEFIDCCNPSCYGGGFSIGSIIGGMVARGETDWEDDLGCKGYEGSPKGKRKYKDCWNRFKVKVRIEYKESESKGGTG